MIHKRLKSDFNADPNDFKQMFGMGKGSLPALSLFAMPAVDLTSSGKAHKVRLPAGQEYRACLLGHWVTMPVDVPFGLVAHH